MAAEPGGRLELRMSIASSRARSRLPRGTGSPSISRPPKHSTSKSRRLAHPRQRGDRIDCLPCCDCSLPLLAHRVNAATQHLVAFGAKRTLAEPSYRCELWVVCSHNSHFQRPAQLAPRNRPSLCLVMRRKEHSEAILKWPANWLATPIACR
jgi:hypothetical protein